jgi:hypothetical protein
VIRFSLMNIVILSIWWAHVRTYDKGIESIMHAAAACIMDSAESTQPTTYGSGQFSLIIEYIQYVHYATYCRAQHRYYCTMMMIYMILYQPAAREMEL